MRHFKHPNGLNPTPHLIIPAIKPPSPEWTGLAWITDLITKKEIRFRRTNDSSKAGVTYRSKQPRDRVFVSVIFYVLDMALFCPPIKAPALWAGSRASGRSSVG